MVLGNNCCRYLWSDIRNIRSLSQTQIGWCATPRNPHARVRTDLGLTRLTGCGSRCEAGRWEWFTVSSDGIERRKVVPTGATLTQEKESTMLVLSRHRDESIMIGDDVVVTIVDIRGDKVRLGIEAPTDIPVHRQEVYDAIKRENEKAARLQPKDTEKIESGEQPND